MPNTDIIIEEPQFTPDSGWTCGLYVADTGKTVAHTNPFESRDAALEAARCLRSKVIAQHQRERAAALFDLGK